MQQSDRPYQDASETVSPVKTAESNLKLPVIMKSVSTQKVETNEIGTDPMEDSQGVYDSDRRGSKH